MLRVGHLNIDLGDIAKDKGALAAGGYMKPVTSITTHLPKRLFFNGSLLLL